MSATSLDNQLICGDCLTELPKLHDKSIDMVLTDLPYGVTTRNQWDKKLPTELLFEQLRRICRGAVVMTATQPFASELIYKNREYFKYEWIWQKEKGTGFLNSKIQPLREHEQVLVFYDELLTYNPQFKKGKPYIKVGGVTESKNYGYFETEDTRVNDGFRFPTSILKFSRDDTNHGIHPTQKPVALYEYLIKTYTMEEDTVLDCCAGSGTTAIACLNSNRNYICIESDPETFQLMRQRISNRPVPLMLFASCHVEKSK